MKTINRTVRLPIVYPGEEIWQELRVLACQAARYGNRVLAGQYASKSGLIGDVLEELGVEASGSEVRKAVERVTYRDYNEELSGWTRNAMKQARCRAAWTARGKLILRGSERLACYSADRALTIQADQRSNRGARYEWCGDDPILSCRFRPARTHKPIRLKVALETTAMRKDPYIRERIEGIWDGDLTPGSINFVFDARRRKLYAHISYSVEVPDADAEGLEAVLGPLTEDRQLWLRVGDTGPESDWSDRIRRLAEMKEHYAGIVDRLRRKAGRKGRSGRYRKYRRKLDEIGSFSDWAHGFLHEWSAHLLDWLEHCYDDRPEDLEVGTLVVDGIDDGEWPAHELSQMLAYKCEERRIDYRESADDEPAWLRAKQRKARKEAQVLRRAEDGLNDVEKAVELMDVTAHQSTEERDE